MKSCFSLGLLLSVFFFASVSRSESDLVPAMSNEGSVTSIEAAPSEIGLQESRFQGAEKVCYAGGGTTGYPGYGATCALACAAAIENCKSAGYDRSCYNGLNCKP